MMNSRRFIGLLFLWVTFSWSTNCLAQDQAAAEALFRSAQKAAKMGDWVTACDRFEESNRLDPAPGTLLNLGRCREKLGQLARAWKSYVKAAQVLPVGDERAEFAEQKAGELEPRVPKLTLVPPETEVPFLVIIGGVAFSQATYNVPLPFDPGMQRIVVRSEGREDAVIDVQLSEGANVEKRLFLGETRSESGDALELARERRARGKNSVAVGVTLALGSLGTAAGIGGGVWASIELPKVNEHCDDGSCDRTGANAAERGRIATIMSLAGVGVAVIGFSVATVLLVKKKESAVALVPVPGGTMLSFRGRM